MFSINSSVADKNPPFRHYETTENPRIRKLCLSCKQKLKYNATINSNHSSLTVAPNLLEFFAVSAPNWVGMADITYIPLEEDWLYFAGTKDLRASEIVGQAMSERMTQKLVGKDLF